MGSDEGLDFGKKLGVMLAHGGTNKVGPVLPSMEKARTYPRIPVTPEAWDCSYVPDNALQRFIQQALGYAPKARDHYDKLIQKKSGTTGKPIYDIERGKSAKPSVQTLIYISEVLRQPMDLLTRASQGEMVDAIEWYEVQPDLPPEVEVGQATEGRIAQDLLEKLNLAAIPDASHSYAMGSGSFLEGVSVYYRYFDRTWIRSVTDAPADGLLFVRGVGDSMLPTIHEDDGVLINTGEYLVDRQDRIWAFTYGGLGMIKRIRRVPSPDEVPRYLIISDNPAVESFTVSGEEIAVRGRVVWVSRRV